MAAKTATRDERRPTDLLTTAQVAERYGVTVDTVLRWVKLGVVPAMRLGLRDMRYRAADVERALLRPVAAKRPQKRDAAG